MDGDQAFYRAFISYSHADKATAAWLHRALEGYRIPAKLVGEETAVGLVPARLSPIFRDREELPAAGELAGELQAALRNSMFLILIASPSAATSHWVNEEVRQFKAMRGEGRVLTVVADGAPGGRGGAECFPPALRFRVTPDGTVTDLPTEPMAADLRAHQDGRKLALLKLVAGLTGVRLDALVQRDTLRRQRRMARFATAASLLAVAMTVLALLAVRGQAEAEHQRAQSDSLVEFMLVDLRKRLEPVGRLEVLDAVGQRAMRYYAGQELDRLDAAALGRRARAQHLVGEVRNLRGDSAGGLQAFTEAEATTARLLALAPRDAGRIFDHAQSAYWVGAIAFQRGDTAAAEARFREYDRLAAKLIAADPAKSEWQQEQAYAHNNLGVLFADRRRFAEAVDRFRRGQAIERRLAAAAPRDAEHQWLLAQGHAWLADALAGTLAIGAALDERRQELAIYERVLAGDAHHARALEGRAVALMNSAALRLLRGENAEAQTAATASFTTIVALARTDPANRSWQEIAVYAGNTLAEAQMLNGAWPQAAATNGWALARARELVRLDPTARAWRRNGLMPARWMETVLCFRRGDRDAARARIVQFEREFAADRTSAGGAGGSNARIAWTIMLAMAGLDARARGDTAAADRDLADALGQIGATPSGGEIALARFIRERQGQANGLVSAPEVRYDAQRLFTAIGGA